MQWALVKILSYLKNDFDYFSKTYFEVWTVLINSWKLMKLIGVVCDSIYYFYHPKSQKYSSTTLQLFLNLLSKVEGHISKMIQTQLLGHMPNMHHSISNCFFSTFHFIGSFFFFLDVIEYNVCVCYELW